MLRIEEIVGALDDEFRYSLEALDDDTLARLFADKAALRRMRPVGISNAEAQAMITAIQARRTAPVAAKPERPKPKKRHTQPKPAKPVLAAPAEPEPEPSPATVPSPPLAPPLLALPAHPAPLCLPRPEKKTPPSPNALPQDGSGPSHPGWWRRLFHKISRI